MDLARPGLVRALNNEQGFDQFTIGQLAGDQLRDATDDQEIAFLIRLVIFGRADPAPCTK
jgi:hypothetical protein